MVDFPVVCPVCGAREELRARTVGEVSMLMACALPACPVCGWAREEDHKNPVWDHFQAVYTARLDGGEIKQGLVDELSRGL
jgi:hypothetical protein